MTRRPSTSPPDTEITMSMFSFLLCMVDATLGGVLVTMAALRELPSRFVVLGAGALLCGHALMWLGAL